MNKKRNKLSIPISDIMDPEKAQKTAELVVKKMQENKGMTLQQAVGLSDEILEQIYSLAHAYYNLGKYQEASSLFQVLISTSPSTYKYALGLAASFHQLKLYQDAVNGFMLAYHIDPKSPISPFFIADSLIKLGEYPDLAETFLDLAIDSCNADKNYHALKERSILMKQFNNKEDK